MEKRKFIFKGNELPDPDPTMSPLEVRDLYASQYPELTSAAIAYPSETAEGDLKTYEYTSPGQTTVGTTTDGTSGGSKSAGSATVGGKTVEFKPAVGRRG